MEECKFCGYGILVKNGQVREVQRFKYKQCGKSQVAGDERV